MTIKWPPENAFSLNAETPVLDGKNSVVVITAQLGGKPKNESRPKGPEGPEVKDR